MATLGKSRYLSEKILDHVLGGGDYTRPATVYVALYTVMPNSLGIGGTEVSGGSYARVSSTNNNTNWPAASSSLKSNGTAITFTTATGSWGTVVGFGIYDASSGGNLLYFGEATTQKAIANTDTYSIAVGNLQLTEA
jgi:hypothetical protein